MSMPMPMSMAAGKGTRGALIQILSRCIRAPMRALGRARDKYVSSMSGCAGRSAHGGGGGGRAAVVASAIALGAAAARSRGRRAGFSFSEGGGGRDEDFGELVRAASRRAEEKTDPAAAAAAAAAAAGGPRRSRSVAGIGRIDEETECEFGSGGDSIGSCGVGDRNCRSGVGLRSRSCAVPMLSNSNSRRAGVVVPP